MPVRDWFPKRVHVAAGRQWPGLDLPLVPNLALAITIFRWVRHSRKPWVTESRGSGVVVVPPLLRPAGDGTKGSEWGLAVQLYALRSTRNWGVGDFTIWPPGRMGGQPKVGAGIIRLNPFTRSRIRVLTTSVLLSDKPSLFERTLYRSGSPA